MKLSVDKIHQKLSEYLKTYLRHWQSINGGFLHHFGRKPFDDKHPQSKAYIAFCLQVDLVCRMPEALEPSKNCVTAILLHKIHLNTVATNNP